MQDKLLFMSERKCSRAYSQWIGSYHWDAFLTVRFDSGALAEDFQDSLSCESSDDRIPLEQAALQIRKNVFYKLERLNHHTVAALGAIMPRTRTEPRHAHYCLKLFRYPVEEEEAAKVINRINRQFSELRNLICTSPTSVVLVSYRQDKHPYYIAKDKNLMRPDALPDSFRPGDFVPLLKQAA